MPEHNIMRQIVEGWAVDRYKTPCAHCAGTGCHRCANTGKNIYGMNELKAACDHIDRLLDLVIRVPR